MISLKTYFEILFLDFKQIFMISYVLIFSISNLLF